MSRGLLIVISAPSGAGKTTICRFLLERVTSLRYSISTTTRPQREGEKNGVDYYFLTREEFEKKIENNVFLEYAQVYNNYYGTSRETVESILNQGYHVLIDVDTQGAHSIKKALPEAILIFIMPPSIGDLEKRLRERGKDADDVIQLRLSCARDEINKSYDYDYIVVNDVVEKAVSDIEAIIRAEQLRSAFQIDSNSVVLGE
ncbi:MAG: guanylate kinase [Candidatus Auribacter fodinae]|jgi:guanylate kinase|uniref:Guanylate kinase n=1 Tax=Candidatus Auribacter fodinae TaxID=2093366 RepID=A0A3A4QRN4_9BACT|nr:MAG: guanylate kinase [Candidatus Auribacter fodinae]